MNLYKTITIASIALCLSGCFHKNPLKTNTHQDSARFLMNASANAERRLKLFVKAGDLGLVYAECMDGYKDKTINCANLFEAMLKFAAENHYPAFKNLSLSDLTDKESFEALADDILIIAAEETPKLVDKR